MRLDQLRERIATHRQTLEAGAVDVTGVERLGQSATVGAPPPGAPPGPPGPGGPAPDPAAMGSAPVDASVPVVPGPLGDGGMPGADHDPAVADAVRSLRDQVDEMQRGQEDSNESLRELGREIRELRLDDAPPEERDQEMDRMRENLDDASARPASVGEYGVREPGLTAGHDGRNPMSQYRNARLARETRRRQAQSNAHGEIFPSGTGVDLENDHWNADSPDNAPKTTPPPTAPTTTEGEMDKVEGDDIPVWIEQTAKGVTAVDLELVSATGTEQFIVVSDRVSVRPIAVLHRPASLAAKAWGTNDYAATLQKFIATRGLARTLQKLGATPVGVELAAKLRARRAQVADAGAAGGAAAAPVVPGADLFDDPIVAQRIDQIVRAHDAARERTFKLAWTAAAMGQIDLPLRGALRTMLSAVTNGDPSSIIEDAFLETGEATYAALNRQASAWMADSPGELAIREQTILGIAPRRAAPLRSEAGDLRHRAAGGSYVPVTAGRGSEFQEEAHFDGVPNLVPELEGTLRLRSIASRQPQFAPRGSFRG